MKNITLKSGRTLTIRRVEADDAEAILGYLKQVGGESDNLLFGAEGLPYTLEEEREALRRFAEAKTSTMLVGVSSDRIVSIVNLSAPTRERIAHTSDIGVSVLKEYWHDGVGTAMLTALVEFARATGVIEIIHLEVRADNLRAIGLYEKIGFSTIGRYPRRIRVGPRYYDTILMNLNL